MAAKGSSKASSSKSAMVKASTPKMPKIAAPKATKATAPKVAMPKATKAATPKAPKAPAAKAPAKRSSGKRELINTDTDARYVKRNEKGQFKESDDVGLSLAADRRQKAKTVVQPGFGDQGDQKPKAKKPAAKKPAAKKSGGK